MPAEPSCYSIDEGELKSGSPYRLSAIAFHRSPTGRKPGVEVMHQGDGVQRYVPRSGESMPASRPNARDPRNNPNSIRYDPRTAPVAARRYNFAMPAGRRDGHDAASDGG